MSNTTAMWLTLSILLDLVAIAIVHEISYKESLEEAPKVNTKYNPNSTLVRACKRILNRNPNKASEVNTYERENKRRKDIGTCQ